MTYMPRLSKAAGLRPETALAHWGKPGRLFLLQAVRFGEMAGEGSSIRRNHASMPRYFDLVSASPDAVESEEEQTGQ